MSGRGSGKFLGSRHENNLWFPHGGLGLMLETGISKSPDEVLHTLHAKMLELLNFRNPTKLILVMIQLIAAKISRSTIPPTMQIS